MEKFTLYLLTKSNDSDIQNFLKKDFRTKIKASEDCENHTGEKECIYKFKLDEPLFSGIGYVWKSANRKYVWENQVNKIFEKSIPENLNYITKVLIIIKIDNDYVALSFSGGIMMIDEKYICKDFGIVTAKKCLDSKELNEIKHYEFFEGNLTNTLSSLKYISERRQNENKDPRLIKNLKGKFILEMSPNEKYELYIQGYSSIVMNGHLDIKTDLINIIRNLIKIYGQKSINILKWENEVLKENDEVEIKKLEKRLADKIQRMTGSMKTNEVPIGHFKNIGFNIENISELSPNITAFKFSKMNKVYDYQHLLDTQQEYSNLCIYLKKNNIKKPNEIIKELKSILVYTQGDSNKNFIRTSYTFWKTVYFECAIDDKLYFLFNGDWYFLNKKYSDYLKNTIDNIPSKPFWGNEEDNTEIKFVDFKNTHLYLRKKEKKYVLAESSYNIGLTRRNNQDYTQEIFCLDQQDYTPKYKKGNSSVEPCDVFGYDRKEKKITMIHIKRGDGSDSFSHLISQTRNSSILLKNDKGFIEHIKNLTHVKLPDNIEKYNIVIGCIVPNSKIKNKTGKRKNSETFPILSMISIVDLYENLKNLDMNLYVAKIPDMSNAVLRDKLNK